MLQKASFTRPELQVETEQRKNLEFISIGFLHIEQTANSTAIPQAYFASQVASRLCVTDTGFLLPCGYIMDVLFRSACPLGGSLIQPEPIFVA